MSGGLDSTIVTSYAATKVTRLNALTFNYGQTHVKEIECATNITSTLNISHKVIDISFVQNLSWYSALTNPDEFKTPTDRPTKEISENIPITYVPARNTIFLSFCLAYAEVKKAGNIFLGVNAVDYSGYPDCRPEFILAMINIQPHTFKGP